MELASGIATGVAPEAPAIGGATIGTWRPKDEENGVVMRSCMVLDKFRCERCYTTIRNSRKLVDSRP